MLPKDTKIDITDFNLGPSFIQKDHRLIISDPAYDMIEYDSKIYEILNAGKTINHVWQSYYQMEDGFLSNLVLILNDDKLVKKDLDYKFRCELGIDTAMIGIYDSDSYRNDSLVKNLPRVDYLRSDDDGELWRAHCCHVLRKSTISYVPNGILVDTGGDGTANLYTAKHDSKLSGIYINF